MICNGISHTPTTDDAITLARNYIFPGDSYDYHVQSWDRRKQVRAGLCCRCKVAFLTTDLRRSHVVATFHKCGFAFSSATTTVTHLKVGVSHLQV